MFTIFTFEASLGLCLNKTCSVILNTDYDDDPKIWNFPAHCCEEKYLRLAKTSLKLHQNKASLPFSYCILICSYSRLK